jgi:hypothetical protein
MTYSSGQRIQATDYNTIAWTNPSIGGQWGIGYGNHGLGQGTGSILNAPNSIVPIPTPTPSTLTPVTAVQWSNLLSTINKCLMHYQLSPVIPGGPIITGNPIAAIATLQQKSIDSYNATGQVPVTLSYSNPATTTTSYSGSWGASGSNSLKQTITVNFGSGDAARYFFNAGGVLNFNMSRTGGSSTTVNTSWQNLCSAVNTISFGFTDTKKLGGTGSVDTIRSVGNGGYWSGTTGYVVHFKQFDTSASYTSDYIQIEYRWGGSPANGGYSILEFIVSFVNTSADAVNGVTSTAVTIGDPASTYVVATWGIPSITGVSNLV